MSLDLGGKPENSKKSEIQSESEPENRMRISVDYNFCVYNLYIFRDFCVYIYEYVYQFYEPKVNFSKDDFFKKKIIFHSSMYLVVIDVVVVTML